MQLLDGSGMTQDCRDAPLQIAVQVPYVFQRRLRRHIRNARMNERRRDLAAAERAENDVSAGDGEHREPAAETGAYVAVFKDERCGVIAERARPQRAFAEHEIANTRMETVGS